MTEELKTTFHLLVYIGHIPALLPCPVALRGAVLAIYREGREIIHLQPRKETKATTPIKQKRRTSRPAASSIKNKLIIP